MSSLPTAIPSCLSFAICWSTETVTVGSKNLCHIPSLREPRGNRAIAKVCCAFAFFFFVVCRMAIDPGNVETDKRITRPCWWTEAFSGNGILFVCNKTVFMFTGINIFSLAALGLILARAVRRKLKWALRKGQNILMFKNINCITIIITMEGIEREKKKKKPLKKITTKQSEEYFFHERGKKMATTL